MGNQNVKVEDMTNYEGAPAYEARVAAAVHKTWQEAQPLCKDGTRLPRLKKKTETSTDQLDIANSKFADLPEKWKQANVTTANMVVGEILRHVKKDNARKTNNKLDDIFVESAAHFTHQRWIMDHQYSSNIMALTPYYLLRLRHKNMLRRFVRAGIDLYNPESYNMDSRIFPPRDLVVVPLKELVDEDPEEHPWDGNDTEDDKNNEDNNEDNNVSDCNLLCMFRRVQVNW